MTSSGHDRVNAQLIDAIGGHQLWAERYDGEMSGVFGLQDKVIGQIVSTLSVKLTGGAATGGAGDGGLALTGAWAGDALAGGGAGGAATGGAGGAGAAGGIATSGAGGAGSAGTWGSHNGDDSFLEGISSASADAVIDTNAFNQQIVLGANLQGNTIDMTVVGGDYSSTAIGEDEDAA